MIDLETIEQKAKRLYSKFLRSKMRGLSFFPLDIPFSKKLPATFTELNRSLLALEQDSSNHKRYSYCIDYEMRKTRKFGEQSLPVRLYFKDERSFLGFLQKREEAPALLACFEQLKKAFPNLADYFLQKPLRLRNYLDETASYLEVLHYFVAHPRPGLYIRELPLSVHSKFIEQNQKQLRPLLDWLLPEDTIEDAAKDFIGRYGLRKDEARVRFRQLDMERDELLFRFSSDLSLPLSHFLQLDVEAEQVLICENLMPFLTLPPTYNCLGIFGQGFAVSQLAEAKWLKTKKIYYWGDLDAHGFYILSLLRAAFPQVQSLLMDRSTFAHYERFAVANTAKILMVEHLQPAEQQLLGYLQEQGLRLEQERIPLSAVQQALNALSG